MQIGVLARGGERPRTWLRRGKSEPPLATTREEQTRDEHVASVGVAEGGFGFEIEWIPRVARIREGPFYVWSKDRP